MKYVASVHLTINGTEYELDSDGDDAQATASRIRDRLNGMVEGNGPTMALIPVRPMHGSSRREVIVLSTELARLTRVFARMHHAAVAA